MKTKPFKLVIAILLSLTGVCFIVAGIYLYYNNIRENKRLNVALQNSDSNQNKIKEEKPQIKIIKPTQFQANITFLGDVFWGRYINDWSQASQIGFEYPFSGLNTLKKDSDDFWVAGLECPITESDISSREQENLLKFSCKPEYLQEAQKYFDVFTLANNHTDNMNEIDGFNKTKDYLDRSGIEYFGHYDNKLDEICKVIEVPVKPILSPIEQSQIDVKTAQLDQQKYISNIAFCSFHGVFRVPTELELNQINEFSKNYPTFVMPHMGAEYVTRPDSLKENLYRQMIDRGALAVIGNHPHAIQNSAWYSDKLIAYSLGNLIFDQQSSQLTTTSIVLESQLLLDYSNSQNPTTDIKYDYKVTDNSNKLAKLASQNSYDYASRLFIFNNIPHKNRFSKQN
jgi:poly-gamma-glutamate synthesis protein (capsule biosynthesis protein)